GRASAKRTRGPRRHDAAGYGFFGPSGATLAGGASARVASSGPADAGAPLGAGNKSASPAVAAAAGPAPGPSKTSDPAYSASRVMAFIAPWTRAIGASTGTIRGRTSASMETSSRPVGAALTFMTNPRL